MPFGVRKQSGGKYVVINTRTGDVKGTHSNKAKANAQVQALYANTKDEKK